MLSKMQQMSRPLGQQGRTAPGRPALPTALHATGLRVPPSGRNWSLNSNGCVPAQQLCQRQSALPSPQRWRRIAARAEAAGASGASQQQQKQQQKQQQQRQQRESGATGHVTNTVATPAGEVQWGSFLSVKPGAAEAVEEAVAAIRGGFGDGAAFQPELALVFATAAYGGGLEEVVPALRQLVPSLRNVFGCTVGAPAPVRLRVSLGSDVGA